MTTGTTSGSSTSTTSSASSARAAGLATCATSRLAISLHPLGTAGLNHGGDVIVFANRGPACVLDGYPGVDGLAHGQAVVHATRTARGYLGGASPRRVVLATGHSASALLEGLQGAVPGHPCPSYSKIAVTPPNDRPSVTLAIPQRFCSPQVHAVTTGTRGGST
jgi:hypothetical protein